MYRDLAGTSELEGSKSSLHSSETSRSARYPGRHALCIVGFPQTLGI